LAWLARHERIVVAIPSSFPGDPADRLISQPPSSTVGAS
jgi:hypothetical protein